jgi:general secretion pathway protein A
MYEKFYGLDEKPFNVTPDPRFLYLGERHQEALAHLIYGIYERKGFMVLTGEVGTGKTTLINTLLERMDKSVKTALIFNPNLTLRDLFISIKDEFGLNTGFKTKADFLNLLNRFLIERLKRKENSVLIIDEAQNLSPSILEEIRLLLNLETSKDKLLQVILSGQPELDQKLNMSQLRQLKQRISMRYHLHPLEKEETSDYIKERMRIAGCRDHSIFTDKAITEIYKFSKGIPRLINIISDNSLLIGYATDQPKIIPKIVRECIEDLRLDNKNNGEKAKTPKRFSVDSFKRRVLGFRFI